MALSVDVKDRHVLALPELPVAPQHNPLCQPRQRRRRDAKRRAARHGEHVPRGARLGPQVGRPHEAAVHERGDEPNGRRLLLLGLRAHAAAPPEDQAVDAVRPDGEDDHGGVPPGHVPRRGGRGGDEAHHRDGLGGGDVPCALVESARGPRDEDGDGAGDEVGRAGEHEGDGGVEVEGLDDGGELQWQEKGR